MRRVFSLARRLRKAATDAERQLWIGLRGRQLGGFRFRRHFPIGGFATDFACVEARLVVEVDDGAIAGCLHDAVRAQKLELCGYRVLRFREAEVVERPDDVLDEILRQAQASPTARCGTPASVGAVLRVKCPLCGA